MVAALVASLVLVVPPGFYESKVLEPAASSVAGKPMRIYCASTVGDWRTYAERASGNLATLGLTIVGSDTSMLSSDACGPLRQQLRHKAVAPLPLAKAMLTLTHEATHASGVRDEAVTDCRALSLLPLVAHRYFGFAYHRKPLRLLMAAAWRVHRAAPDEYLTRC